MVALTQDEHSCLGTVDYLYFQHLIKWHLGACLCFSWVMGLLHIATLVSCTWRRDISSFSSQWELNLGLQQTWGFTEGCIPGWPSHSSPEWCSLFHFLSPALKPTPPLPPSPCNTHTYTTHVMHSKLSVLLEFYGWLGAMLGTGFLFGHVITSYLTLCHPDAFMS